MVLTVEGAAQFSELVVGSDQRSQTSLTVGNSQISGRANNVVSDDAGNSDLMVRRKIRVSFKDIRASFRDLVDADGKIVSQRNAPTQPLNRGLNAGVWGAVGAGPALGAFALRHRPGAGAVLGSDGGRRRPRTQRWYAAASPHCFWLSQSVTRLTG